VLDEAKQSGKTLLIAVFQTGGQTAPDMQRTAWLFARLRRSLIEI